MQRRSLLRLCALTPLALLPLRSMKALRPDAPIPADYRERAERLNSLAANIRTPADAHHLVDFLADIFSDVLPPAWTIVSCKAVRERQRTPGIQQDDRRDALFCLGGRTY